MRTFLYADPDFDTNLRVCEEGAAHICAAFAQGRSGMLDRIFQRKRSHSQPGPKSLRFQRRPRMTPYGLSLFGREFLYNRGIQCDDDDISGIA